MTRQIQNGSPVVTEFEGFATSGHARLQQVDVTRTPTSTSADYLIATQCTGAVSLENPTEQSYYHTQLGGRLGGLAVAHLPQMGTGGVTTVTLDSLGPGQLIEGRSTQRYRVVVTMTLAESGPDSGIRSHSGG
jgi:hypothetical protein